MGLIKTKVARENYTVLTMSDMFELGMLREDHPQQRRADQHSNAYRDGFIVTVVKNEDFDPIKVCEQILDVGTVNWLIDGVQRLSEIKSYRHNAFALGNGIETPIIEYQVAKKVENQFVKDENGNPVYETLKFDLRGKRYKDLPRELQVQFDRCPIECVKHLDCTDSEIAYHIRRYNHTKSMNNSQVSVTYTEKRAAQIKGISVNNKFFLDCGQYSEKERKNGSIERIVMESAMSTFHLFDWKKQANKMGGYINDNVTKEEFATLNDYFTRLYPLCDGKYKDIFNAKNTFIFIALFDRFAKLGLEDSKFAEFLNAFEDSLHSKEIDSITYDVLDENRVTKDKSVVTGKIEFLEKLMKDYFQIEEESCGEVVSDEEFIASVVGTSVESVKEDIDLYNETLDDLLNNHIKDGSKLLDDENRASLLAMVAYSFKHDEDLDNWLEDYAEKNITYLKDQNKNYLHMLEDFKKFVAKVA